MNLVGKIKTWYEEYEEDVFLAERGLEDKFDYLYSLWSTIIIHDDGVLDVSFHLETPPMISAIQILKLSKLEGVKEVRIFEGYIYNDENEIIWESDIQPPQSEKLS